MPKSEFKSDDEVRNGYFGIVATINGVIGFYTAITPIIHHLMH